MHQRVFRIGDTFKKGELPEFDGSFIDDVYSISSGADCSVKRWFVVYVRPTHKAAERVERFVTRRGFSIYWPRRVRLIKRGRGANRRPVADKGPLLPRYVLVRLPGEKPPFGALTDHEAQFNGICGILGNSHGPVYVKDSDVDDIQAREDGGEFDDTARQGKRVVAKVPTGAKVRIIDGPFASFEALIERALKNGNLRVTLNVFGRATSTELSLDQLERTW